ncbi:hypothetical protein BDY19DRAFT_960672 [Irpex rosettiformis]|uniref:Uncharacterized protein n=1 Tax=Irpex rosettiformis TaxID=378272 RepID=A0ACB8TXC1_9APHY|nr:hypothetical protein BDY19DRAFT_960672 [Irpex rosettiformis]
MGFFSSRRPEQLEEQLNNDSTVVRVIRSRFYGSKQKGKDRDVPQPSSSSSISLPQPTALAHSPPTRSDTLSIHDTGSSPRTTDRYQPTASSSLRPRPENLSISSETARTSTDAVTITLAQRLNELALANTQGLLDDDEYRLLRQNLFERLAAGSTIPTEAPVVPVATTRARDHSHTESQDSSVYQRRTSLIVPSGSRTPSLSSKRSLTSTVSGFLRRTPSKRRQSSVGDTTASDTGSVMSTPRTPDRFTFAIPMSKQQSAGSPRTDHTRSPLNADTHASRHTMYERSSASQVFRPPRTPEKTVRRLPSVPPSSFPGGHLSQESQNAHMSLISNLEDDDERLQTTAEIKREIAHIEAEGRRLLDAFNGLELSTLVRQQRRPGNAPLSSASLLTSPVDSEASWKTYPSPSSKPPSVRTGKDADTVSIVSASSGRTALSQKRSPSMRSRARQVNASNNAPIFQPITLSRKTSISSISSRHKNGVPSLGRLGLGSTSSLNLRGSSSNLPLATVSETGVSYVPSPLKSATSIKPPLTPFSASGSQYSDSVKNLRDDDDILALEAEMADIRKRRVEVTARYEARLEYLEARLKGAELREKLLKR